MSTEEKLAKLHSILAKCRDQCPVHAGRTDADYLFRDRVNRVIDLFLAWLDYELTEEEKELKRVKFPKTEMPMDREQSAGA